MNKYFKQYLRRVRSRIQCSRRKREELIKPLLHSMQSYSLDNTNASYDDLVSAFGTPEEMVAMLEEKLSASEISVYKRKRLLLIGLLIFVICLSIIWSIYILCFAVVPVDVVQTVVIE